MAEEATTQEETKEIPAKFKSLVGEIEKLSVLDLSDHRTTPRWSPAWPTPAPT